VAGSASSVTASRARSGARRPRPKVYGCTVPRVYTPPLRPLEPRTPETELRTLGYLVCDFAADTLRIELLPWQKWLLVHMLELLEDNRLRFRIVVVLVARQNGKSTLSQVLALWMLYVYGIALVLGTAQDLDTAEEVWQGAVDLVEELDEDDNPVRPTLLSELHQVVKNNGKKALVLKRPPRTKYRPRYKVKAANRKAGRGLSGDLILLDELREHQSWDAWGAITKTTMARALALIVALSNAGDASSIVLRYLRKLAHAALGDPDGINGDDEAADLLPTENELDELEDVDDLDDLALDEDDDSLGIFEWSAPPGCDIRDRQGWAQANPSLNHNPEFTERTIASAARTDPEWVFRTEVLCQWSEGSLDGPFPAGAWEKCRDEASAIVSGSQLAACVEVSWDRSTSYVAVAGWRADGLPHVEVVARRTGTDWVVPWLTSEDRDAALRGAPVAVQASGAPASSLLDPMRKAGVNVVEWKGPALGGGTGMFYDRVRAAVGEGAAGAALRHRGQPVLDVAAGTAVTKPLGDGWVWDRARSPNDAAPLVGVTGALWLLLTHEPEDTTPPAPPQVLLQGDVSESAADLDRIGF
jgi:hypothetical protein